MNSFILIFLSTLLCMTQAILQAAEYKISPIGSESIPEGQWTV
jgi:hypothetical protein